MAANDPVTELDARFSSDGAHATPWAVGRQLLETADLYWLTTVRPDGRPHVTPLISVWVDEGLYFCTGPTERKAENLSHNKNCILMTGSNSMTEGLDVVIEGEAVATTDDATLGRIADAFESKYGSEWHFDLTDGGLESDGGKALVFRVVPAKGFGFKKGEYGQTRWLF